MDHIVDLAIIKSRLERIEQMLLIVYRRIPYDERMHIQKQLEKEAEPTQYHIKP